MNESMHALCMYVHTYACMYASVYSCMPYFDIYGHITYLYSLCELASLCWSSSHPVYLSVSLALNVFVCSRYLSHIRAFIFCLFVCLSVEFS